MARFIEMTDKKWEKRVLQNFDAAAVTYNQNAKIQQTFANKLAAYCAEKVITPGIWIDLGSGTGLLADSLEELHENQSVCRVDGSYKMLEQHDCIKQKQMWDLNTGLPTNWSQPPHLIASSFALHWLEEPQEKIQEWFAAIAPGGWLAIVVPVQGSFPEWHQAASLAQVKCSAMNFPSQEDLTKNIPASQIELNRLEKFTQAACSVTSLLKPFINVGAQTSPIKPLPTSHLRRLYKAWPLSTKRSEFHLTWTVQILLAQK